MFFLQTTGYHTMAVNMVEVLTASNKHKTLLVIQPAMWQRCNAENYTHIGKIAISMTLTVARLLVPGGLAGVFLETADPMGFICTAVYDNGLKTSRDQQFYRWKYLVDGIERSDLRFALGYCCYASEAFAPGVSIYGIYNDIMGR